MSANAFAGEITYRGENILDQLLTLNSDEVYPFINGLTDNSIQAMAGPKGYFKAGDLPGTIRLIYDKNDRLDQIVI